MNCVYPDNMCFCIECNAYIAMAQQIESEYSEPNFIHHIVELSFNE